MGTQAIIERMSPAKRTIEGETYSKLIAKRMRELREKRGWGVDKLTAEINRYLSNGLTRVAQSTVHGWDNGARKVNPDYYPAIARAYRMSIKSFMPNA